MNNHDLKFKKYVDSTLVNLCKELSIDGLDLQKLPKYTRDYDVMENELNQGGAQIFSLLETSPSNAKIISLLN